MLSAIDVPKSKSITIAFMAMKAMLFGHLLTFSYRKVQKGVCNNDLMELTSLVMMFFLLGLVLDTLALFYFYFTRRFSRLEYYVFYCYHILLAGLAIIGAIYIDTENEVKCMSQNVFFGASLAINLIFIISAFFVMWANLYLGLKFAHFGSNIIWTFMWLEGTHCHHFVIGFIGFAHAFLSIIGIVSFFIMNFIGKTQLTSKYWKYLYSLSLFSLILCYLLLLIALPSSHECSQTDLFAKTYQVFGLIEMISPLLLLIFLNTEFGDPRQNILRKEVKIFEGKQHTNFAVDDTN